MIIGIMSSRRWRSGDAGSRKEEDQRQTAPSVAGCRLAGRDDIGKCFGACLDHLHINIRCFGIKVPLFRIELHVNHAHHGIIGAHAHVFRDQNLICFEL